MSKITTPKRIILIVWDWDTGSHPIGLEGSDEWGALGNTDLLVRVDKVNSPGSVLFLSDLIARHLHDGQVLVFLHSNTNTHNYGVESRRQIFEQLAKHLKLADLKISLFSGGSVPIYHDQYHSGFLGSRGNFPRILHNPLTGEGTVVEVLHSAEDKLLRPEPFRYVWSHYWISTRRKVYSLMENLRLWADAFDPADHKRFTQHLREEEGLLWPQLAYFTGNKIELKKLSKQPEQRVSEASDFSQCEQHVELAYGRELGDLYRKARSMVEQVAFLKSHKDAEDFVTARDEMYNALDALQHQLAEHGEALSYDTVALFPR